MITRRNFLQAATLAPATLMGTANKTTKAEEEVVTTHDLKQAVNDYWGWGHQDRPAPKFENALSIKLHEATKASNNDNDSSTPSPKTEPIKFLAQRIDHNVSTVLSSLSEVAFPKPNAHRYDKSWDYHANRIPEEARRAYEKIAAPLATALNDYTKKVTEWVKTFAA